MDKAFYLPSVKQIQEMCNMGYESSALTYMNFLTQHWSRIRTNNTIERLNREIKCRTRAIGAFPDVQSALMLVCARLRHVAGTQWGAKRYINMDHLAELDIQNEADNIAG